MKLQIDVEDRDYLVRQVAELISQDLNRELEAAVKNRVGAMLDERLAAIIDVELGALVQQTLAEGWQPTDQWGIAKGERVSLRERVAHGISDFLDKPKGGYSYDKSQLQKLIDEAIATELKGETGKALDDARAAIKEQVGAVLQGKLRDVLAGAVGLKS